MAVFHLKLAFLIMMITMICHTIVVFRGTIWIVRNEMSDSPNLQCTTLREKFISMKASIIKSITKGSAVTEDLQELMSCPYESNSTQREHRRAQLQFCCNATGNLFLTRKNTHQRQMIQYETSRKKKRVDDSLFKMLPKSTPWRKKSGFQRCAVVGNSGILRNSCCGAEIDSADIVIRLNLAPINNSTDVGVKTSLVTVNPSQILVNYPNLEKHPKPLAERVSAYGDAPIAVSAFTYPFCTGISFTVHRVLQKLRPEQKVVFFNPEYLRELFRYWKRQGLKELRLTTGLMLASVAMELCDDVHLYGFWPFSKDLFLRPVTHHYYDDIGPSRRMHVMPKEFLKLLKMHSLGSIHLHLTQCR
ncbi:hypothetical protein COCON_G00044370 [Conger conger]|uniref:Uncharacterized protein n=1 Tax=Conger conger TaxID=82655 RepID=A0A9Q1DU88_CONCO|nr:alpha-2,8-sialyltransferase 8F-like [Conger conger]KAJ8281918.1 hypothetical protein COCON_G00044370 [Conger conger]